MNHFLKQPFIYKGEISYDRYIKKGLIYFATPLLIEQYIAVELFGYKFME